jgi:uncharacterized membrane protein YqgA involved in biofilm formation
MLGTIVNAIAIIIGGSIGTVFGNSINERYNDIITQAISLSVVLVGLLGAIKTENILLLIISMAIGSLIGEFIDIEKRLNQLGDKLQKRFSKGDHNIAEGFVMATLIFCVGSMAILGSIESGLKNDHTTLFAKSILDCVFSVVFASSLGIGVAFSAISVFLYQGAITLLASQASEILTEAAVTELSAVGGLLIMVIGLNTLKITKIRVGNMLPAVFIPVIYMSFF